MKRMLKNYLKKSNGFTLVELLVVIAIIGLLISISIIAVQRYQKKAVDTRVEANLSQIRNIAAMIYTDDSNYNSLCHPDPNDDTLNESHPRYSLGLEAIESDIYNFTGQYPICHAAGPDYCVQALLVVGDSFCLDGNGYIGENETHCGESDGGNIKCSAP